MQTFKQPLSKELELYYLNRSKEGDLNARNTLVEYNLRLVAHIIKKYNNPEHDIEDLISIGTIGLIKAINTYDLSKGNHLVTYASRCIENELLMMFRKEKKHMKDLSIYEPIGVDKEGNEITYLDISAASNQTALDNIIQAESIAQLKSSLSSCLSPREYTILSLRYGFHQSSPCTQKEVATKLGISRSYVSRIEKKALAKLKKAIQQSPS